MKIIDRRAMANKVWKLLKPKIKQWKENSEVILGSYQNGREQGLSLYKFHFLENPRYIFIAWSENRNSDSIVVYTSQFDPMQSITDEMYKNRTFFDTEETAANFIFKTLKEE